MLSVASGWIDWCERWVHDLFWSCVCWIFPIFKQPVSIQIKQKNYQQIAILVTGTSSGIGRHLAVALAKQKCLVFAGVRRDEDATSLRDEAGHFAEYMQPIILDVTNQATLDCATSTINSVLRERDAVLWGLVANAGIPGLGAIQGSSLDHFQNVLNVNLFGVIRTVKAFLPSIQESKGRIILVSSIAGKVTGPLHSAYCSSKHALEAFADALRRELLFQNVYVSVIAPGAIDTRIWSKAQQQALNADPGAFKSMFKKYEKVAHVGAIPPLHCTNAITHALFSEYPMIRYNVGIDARFLMWLQRAVPIFIFDYITLLSFKLAEKFN